MNVIFSSADAMKQTSFGLQDAMFEVLMRASLDILDERRRIVFRVPDDVQIDLRIHIARHTVTSIAQAVRKGR